MESLPESMQQQVRAGELSAHIAMKYLAPVARASLDACQQMAEAFARHKFPTRQAGELYVAWRDGLRDKGLAIAVDNFGNAFVTGWTLSSNFPVTPGPFQRFKGSTSGVEETALVTKLIAAGRVLQVEEEGKIDSA